MFKREKRYVCVVIEKRVGGGRENTGFIRTQKEADDTLKLGDLRKEKNLIKGLGTSWWCSG